MVGTRKLNSVVAIIILVCLMLVATALLNQSFAVNEKFRAKMVGKNEIPPVNTTANGVINFKTKNDTLTWRMNVTGISDPTGAHIHLGKKGQNGQVIIDLLSAGKHGETPSGMIMRRTIESYNLVGPLKGKTLADLIKAMTNEDTYVNIHTKAYPNGEIRGQIKLKMPSALSNATAVPTNDTAVLNNTVLKWRVVLTSE